jgi:hypothetical protein
MEVIFAVAILAIGLIFLACQFPVGMFSARDNVDQTRKVMETHNSQVMLEVQLSLVNTGRILDNRSDQSNWLLDQWQTRNVRADRDITRLHFLPKPNVLVESLVAGTPTLRLDDPEGLEGYMAYLLTPINIKLGPAYGNYKFEKPTVAPQPPFWTQKPTTQNPTMSFSLTTDVFLGDIGYMMSPPVDETNAKVQKLMRWGRNPEEAIFEVSLESNYSWAAFYKEGEDQYYIFTLRNPRKAVSYAVQDESSFYYLDPPNFWKGPASHPRPRDCYGKIDNAPANKQPVGDWPPAAAPGPAGADRVFPIPWRVCLGPFSKRYRVVDYYEDMEDDRPWDSTFRIPEAVAMILRPGSILIDADPADNDHDGTGPLTTKGSGQLYEVSEVYLDINEEYWVRLRTGLHDDLHYFWVFPPPIIRYPDGSYDFDDWQPVVSVTKKVIDIE